MWRAIFAAVLLTLGFAGHAHAQGCTGGDLPPSAAANLLRPALRCLVNQERATEGLEGLRGSRLVHAAATAHAADMVEHDYFAHSRPGWTLMDRLVLAGWGGGRAGEALEAGCGGLATPAQAVIGLLASAEHRAILLGDYRRMAIAVVPWMYAAGDCPDQGTWVLDLVGPS